MRVCGRNQADGSAALAGDHKKLLERQVEDRVVSADHAIARPSDSKRFRLEPRRPDRNEMSGD
jgi:hypothetical protein